MFIKIRVVIIFIICKIHGKKVDFAFDFNRSRNSSAGMFISHRINNIRGAHTHECAVYLLYTYKYKCISIFHPVFCEYFTLNSSIINSEKFLYIFNAPVCMYTFHYYFMKIIYKLYTYGKLRGKA